MAGQYAKIQRSITSDLDFRKLPPMGKLVYLWIVAQPKLSPCGVLDFIPGRLAVELGIEVELLLAVISGLVDDGYLLEDHETCEIAVRTYVRHDVNTSNSNMLKAVYNALDAVCSARLRFDLTAAMGLAGVPSDPRPESRRSNPDRTLPEHPSNSVERQPKRALRVVDNPVDETPSEQCSNGLTETVRTSLELIPSPNPIPIPAAGSCTATQESEGVSNQVAAAAAAIRLIAEHRLAEEVAARKAQGMQRIKVPSKYLDAIVAPLMAARFDDVAQLLFDNPALTVEELAATIEAESTAAVPWSPNPECSLCEGHPWITDLDDPDGLAHRCPACFPTQESRT